MTHRKDTQKCPPLPLALLLLITSFCTVEDKDVLPPLTMVEKEIYEATEIQRQKRKLAMIRLSVSPFHIKKPHTLTSLSLNECQHPGVSGDAILCDLADACASGALRSLTILSLQDNQIGDAGMISLSEAIGKGSLRLALGFKYRLNLR